MLRSLFVAILSVILLAGCTAPPDDGDDDAPSSSDEKEWIWLDATGPSIPRGEAACATDHDNHILIAGGLVDLPVDVPVAFGVSASVELYDKSNDSWSAGPDLPVPTHHPAVAYANERYWVTGGYPGPTFTPVPQFFSWAPGEESWTVHEPMPVARAAHGAGVVEDLIILVGGVLLDGVSDRVDAYNTSDGSWQRLPDAPTAREHLGVDAVGDSVYVAGGRDGAFDSQITALDIYHVQSGTWTQGPDHEIPRGGSSGAGGPLGFILVGGEATGKTFEEIERFDPINGTWERLPDDPDPRHGLCVAVIGEDIHIISGGHEPGFHVSDTHNVLRAISKDGP